MPPEIVEALVKTIEIKDLSSAAHTWRVVLYTRALAEQFGLDATRLHSVTVGAALHDIGKIDIPDAILQKPGRLSDDEFEIIKRHPVIGYDRLVDMGETDPIVLNLVRHHHERVDGKGYPDGLLSEAIPPGARYFAVIDTFDALTSVRPYRSEVGPAAAERALEELHAGIGSRYCSDCVDAFITLYRRGALGWIMEYYNDSHCALPFTPDPSDLPGRASRRK